jgi:hypothetical protein
MKDIELIQDANKELFEIAVAEIHETKSLNHIIPREDTDINKRHNQKNHTQNSNHHQHKKEKSFQILYRTKILRRTPSNIQQ